jgi:transposase-like protein
MPVTAHPVFQTCPRCEKADVKVTKVRGDSTSYRCRFCGKRFRVAYDGR